MRQQRVLCADPAPATENAVAGNRAAEPPPNSHTATTQPLSRHDTFPCGTHHTSRITRHVCFATATATPSRCRKRNAKFSRLPESPLDRSSNPRFPISAQPHSRAAISTHLLSVCLDFAFHHTFILIILDLSLFPFYFLLLTRINLIIL